MFLVHKINVLNLLGKTHFYIVFLTNYVSTVYVHIHPIVVKNPSTAFVISTHKS